MFKVKRSIFEVIFYNPAFYPNYGQPLAPTSPHLPIAHLRTSLPLIYPIPPTHLSPHTFLHPFHLPHLQFLPVFVRLLSPFENLFPVTHDAYPHLPNLKPTYNPTCLTPAYYPPANTHTYKHAHSDEPTIISFAVSSDKLTLFL